jgi:8-oxo-dGTP pyrophosphatase MutT (NUDIX family)
MKQEKSAGMIVIHHGKPSTYLLLHYHYKSDYWDLVKGHIEPGETRIQTALRELAEETGITTCTVIDGFEHTVKWFFTKESSLVQKEATYFLCTVPTHDITISDEHVGYAWLPIELAKQRTKHRNTRDLLEKAHQYMKSISHVTQ